ncbi:hypothetical protein ACRJ4B_27550 [Streptomyces sp. GTA36]
MASATRRRQRRSAFRSSRATTPSSAPVRTSAALSGVPSKIGGVTVHTGDLVVGDVDGVVALPASGAGRILDRADARVAHENELMKRLREGRSTLDLYDNFETAGR